MIINDTELLNSLHPTYKKGKIIKSCSNNFEIYDQDDLKDEFLFLEYILEEAWQNYQNSRKIYETSNEIWKSDKDLWLKDKEKWDSNTYLMDNNGLEEKHFNSIKKGYKSSIFKFLKACIFKYIISDNSVALKQIIKYIFNNYNNFSDDEFYYLISLSRYFFFSQWEQTRLYKSSLTFKSFFQEHFEKLLREKGENEELTKALNFFFFNNVNVTDLFPWFEQSSKVVSRGKDLYIIYDNDPYLKYQKEISNQLDLYAEIIYEEKESYQAKWKRQIYPKGLVFNGNFDELIKKDETNNYLKAFILRQIFTKDYYSFYYMKSYRKKYIEVINNSKIKFISKDDLLEILNYAYKIQNNYDYYHSLRYSGSYVLKFGSFFRRLARILLDIKKEESIDEDIIQKVKKLILHYSDEIISNYFYQAIGVVFYPDNLGTTANLFLEKNQQYSNQLNEIFIDIYNLGKDSKVKEIKTKEIKVKLKKLPENIINELFNNFINSVLEIDLKTTNNTLLINSNETFFRGLLFLANITNDKSLYIRISELCLKCFTKIPGVGAVSEKIGNACINSLKIVNDLFSLSLLARLKYSLHLPKTKKIIIDILKKEAKKRKITIEDIEDIAIDDFGLKDGKVIFTFEKNNAYIEVKDFNNIEIYWLDNNGKILKTIPTEIKENHQDKVNEIKNLTKEIEKALSTQKERLDGFYLQDRRFKFENWKRLFIENELLQFLGKKLIWKFSTGKKINTGFFNENNFVDYKGKIINNLSEETEVSLWHPLDASIQDVIAWRDFINNNQIRQPFKQAYREIYLLTDAEIKTKTYSNRFAAHILKQHQFSSLARLRFWSYKLIGNYDDGIENETAEKRIDKWNITAEFCVNEMSESSDFNDNGIWLYVSTDQVRFRSGNTKLELKKVPEIVFSEIMRDIDLFVGVASIGNDPVWQDGSGKNYKENYNQYWQNYSFGDLSETSKTRKSALEKILPKLKISKKCSIDGKFLKVKGDFRSYKIHLGSGNILMEPNDQYLCIIPDRKTKSPNENVFLPFEDDKIFSLVLSKAFLLANDSEIKDETILNQIKLS